MATTTATKSHPDIATTGVNKSLVAAVDIAEVKAPSAEVEKGSWVCCSCKHTCKSVENFCNCYHTAKAKADYLKDLPALRVRCGHAKCEECA